MKNIIFPPSLGGGNFSYSGSFPSTINLSTLAYSAGAYSIVVQVQ